MFWKNTKKKGKKLNTGLWLGDIVFDKANDIFDVDGRLSKNVNELKRGSAPKEMFKKQAGGLKD